MNEQTKPNSIIPTKNIADIMKYYEQDATQDKANILLLGPIGHGKTTALATMPGPILIFSFDPSGTKSISSKLYTNGGNVVPATQYEKLSEDTATQLLNSFERQVKSMVKSGEITKFKTVCIDSYTFMSKMYEWHQGMKDQSKNGKLPTQNDYGHIIRYIQNILITLCNAPVHFVLTGHLGKEKDEMTGGMVYQLVAYPSLRTVLPAMFDYCWVVQKRIAQDKTEVVLVTNSALYATKKRTENLADLEWPNLKTVLEKIGGLDTETIELKL